MGPSLGVQILPELTCHWAELFRCMGYQTELLWPVFEALAQSDLTGAENIVSQLRFEAVCLSHAGCGIS
jgi:hypothetical protein